MDLRTKLIVFTYYLKLFFIQVILLSYFIIHHLLKTYVTKLVYQIPKCLVVLYFDMFWSYQFFTFIHLVYYVVVIL